MNLYVLGNLLEYCHYYPERRLLSLFCNSLASDVHPTVYHKFDASESNFEFPSAPKMAFHCISFKYRGQRLAILMPKLKVPYGFNRGLPGHNKSFTCSLSLDNSTPEKKHFVAQLIAFEKLIIRKATENAFAWGLVRTKSEARQITYNQVRDRFYPIIRYRINRKIGDPNMSHPPGGARRSFVETAPGGARRSFVETAPTMRAKFKFREGVNRYGNNISIITSGIWDANEKCINYEEDYHRGQLVLKFSDFELIDESTIPPGCHMISLLEVHHIWVANQRFGVSFRICQAMVLPN